MVKRPGAGSRGTHKGARGRGLCPPKAAPGRAAAVWPAGRAGLLDPGLSLGSPASCLRAAGPGEGGRAGPPSAAAAGGHTCHLGLVGDRGREPHALPGSAARYLSSEPLSHRQQTLLPARCLPTSRLGLLFCLSGKAALDTLCLKLLQTLADRMATRWSLMRKARPSVSEAGVVPPPFFLCLQQRFKMLCKGERKFSSIPFQKSWNAIPSEVPRVTVFNTGYKVGLCGSC